ncbi:hypothetical protein [Cetobacterium sp.]|uniref:hypothetical protein n=1 Tax=Cetobacterium sp. TaxID=2071632 RepID=UPI003F37F835
MKKTKNIRRVLKADLIKKEIDKKEIDQELFEKLEKKQRRSGGGGCKRISKNKLNDKCYFLPLDDDFPEGSNE